MASMVTKSEKSFIPRNVPKSWVICILLGMFFLFIDLPIILLGVYLKLEIMITIGKMLFFIILFSGFPWAVIFFAHHIVGAYENIEEKDWKDQVW